MVNPTAVKACPDCSEAIEETEPRYECQQCGEEFGESNGDGSGNRCPGCGKFAARDGDCHEGCQSSVEDATDGFRCGGCKEVHDSEKEAVECCVEDPDEEEEPVIDQQSGEEIADVQVFKAEVYNYFTVERDEFLVSRHGEELMKEPFWIHYVRLTKKKGKRKSFAAEHKSVHSNGLTENYAWWGGNDIEISVKMKLDPATGLVHAKRVFYDIDPKTGKWGMVEWVLILRPVDRDGLDKWKSEVEAAARALLKEREKPKKKVK
jgi:hypothetical protein